MSQENIKIIRDAAVAFDRGDLDTWLAYLADDIDYRAIEGAIDDHGPLHGRDAVRAHFQDWLDMFDPLTIEPLELIDAGEDQVIAVVRISGRAKLSGVETDLTYAALYTIRDGKVVLTGPRVLDDGAGPRSCRAAGVGDPPFPRSAAQTRGSESFRHRPPRTARPDREASSRA